MALYDCEATAWPKAIGKQVGAQAQNVLLGAHSTARAPELAWAAIEGIEPPGLVVLPKRISAARRWAEKDESYLPKARTLLDVYRRSAARGSGPLS
eukprot:3872787-Alexandrium_andersonii.AAC.1